LQSPNLGRFKRSTHVARLRVGATAPIFSHRRLRQRHPQEMLSIFRSPKNHPPDQRKKARRLKSTGPVCAPSFQMVRRVQATLRKDLVGLNPDAAL